MAETTTTPPPTRPRLLPLAIKIAVAMLVFVVAADAWRQAQRRARSQAPVLSGALSKGRGVSRGGSAAAPSGAEVPGGPAASPTEEAEFEPLALEELMGILEKRVPKEVADEAAQAFMEEPELRMAWKRYTKNRGKKGAASDFVDYITRFPKFKSFVARHGADPGVQEAFAELLKEPRFEDAVRAEPGVGKSTLPMDIVREWERKAVSGVNTGDSTEMLGSASDAGIGDLGAKRQAAWAGTALSGGASSSGGSVIGGAAAAGKAAAQGKQGVMAARPGAHDVGTTMDKTFKTKDAGNQDTTAAQRYLDDARKWIQKFLAALQPDSARKAIQSELESGREDVWGACFATGNWPLCDRVCAQVPESRCGQGTGEWKDPYQACRSANSRGPRECITSCLRNSPIVFVPKPCEGYINRAEWSAQCKQGDATPPLILQQGECPSSMLWGPCRPNPPPGGGCTQETGSRGGTSVATVIGATPPPPPPPPAQPPATTPPTTTAALPPPTSTPPTPRPSPRPPPTTTALEGFDPPSTPGPALCGGPGLPTCVTGPITVATTGSGTGTGKDFNPTRLEGAINGAIAGASIGASIGGMIPPHLIGAGVGAVIGGIGGAVFGAIVPKAFPCIPIKWIKKCP